MNSLRLQLLAWLLPLFLLSAAVALGVSYLQYRDNTGAFMDGQMHRLALAYVQQLRDGAPVPALSPLDEEHVERDGTVIVQFWSADGRLLASTWPIPSLALQGSAGFRDLELDGHGWRVYTAAPGAVRLQVVQSGAFRDRVIFDSALKSGEPIAWLIPFTALLLWLAVYLALRPLDRVVQALARQDERNLADLPLERVPAELRPLIGSMNDLLAHLKQAFTAQQRFVQDAAHELRTPLTALKLQAEVLRQRLGGGSPEELARLEAGIERMQRLVEQLLRLARQEAAPPEQAPVPLDVCEVLRQSLNDLLPLAEARGIDLGLDAQGSGVVRADGGDLRSLFDNLLDNALRYTPAGGRVDVSLKHVGGVLLVEFLDTGPGIPPELLERVFDRFYRVLGSGAMGSGLGLAIARAAAGRAGTQIQLSNRSDGTGLVARVKFDPA